MDGFIALVSFLTVSQIAHTIREVHSLETRKDAVRKEELSRLSPAAILKSTDIQLYMQKKNEYFELCSRLGSTVNTEETRRVLNQIRASPFFDEGAIVQFNAFRLSLDEKSVRCEELVAAYPDHKEDFRRIYGCPKQQPISSSELYFKLMDKLF